MSDPFGVSESSNLSGGIDYPVIDLPAVDFIEEVVESIHQIL